MLNIEYLAAVFGFKKPQIKHIYSTILARRKNADYCCEYLNRYDQKLKVQEALIAAKVHDLFSKGFDYNIFNRSILRCIFYSVVSNNISRIDNLEEMMLELFPDDLVKYTNNPKSFSFKKLCEEYPNKYITSALIVIFEKHLGFGKVQKLRNQIEHSTLNNILDNDPMFDEEDDCFIKSDFTLSGEKEDLADFAKSLNVLLFEIEEQIFDCLMTHGKNCLNDVKLQ
jgi:hypothetical protein